MRLKSLLAASAIVVISLGGASAAQAESATPEAPIAPVEIHEVDGTITDAPVDTKEELLEYIVSAEPKDGVWNPETGEIEEVWVGAKPGGQSRLVQKSCATGDVCLHRNAPLTAAGFSGVGWTFGQWSSVNKVHTGKWLSQVMAKGKWSPGLSGGGTWTVSPASTVTEVKIIKAMP